MVSVSVGMGQAGLSVGHNDMGCTYSRRGGKLTIALVQTQLLYDQLSQVGLHIPDVGFCWQFMQRLQ